jgi:hypothetical protein
MTIEEARLELGRENEDADIDVFGYCGIYTEFDLYCASKRRTAVQHTV